MFEWPWPQHGRDDLIILSVARTLGRAITYYAPAALAQLQQA